jgi:hypothetical protein
VEAGGDAQLSAISSPQPLHHYHDASIPVTIEIRVEVLNIGSIPVSPLVIYTCPEMPYRIIEPLT